ncbi:MAG: dicarboxylate/amino acid:cation symporter [Bacteroidetes bacterium]|nr:MAG: dicarboxylate/amino acid:cation symporter [Bacteroidota bacterium]REJ99996.1 MAG: dicarboxylate/amino acid:cation symporter [Bacteroidota bacterium]REK35824.1 MAG: dicarboxylate/amino acid:cation symporter [Bacteroidota bacterium]REK49305.1 MAG: dicarboxylate/amino acid:cation symporter [Bacteroidota bacterium]
MKLELHWKIFIGLIVGFLFGFFLPEHVSYIAWMGDLFLKALKMIIVPLLLTSIISGIMNIGNPEGLGRMGIRTITYYISTSLLAIVTGLFLVNMIRPGVGADLKFSQTVEGLAVATESFGSTLINIIPENIVRAMVNGEMISIIFISILSGLFATKLDEKYKNVIQNGIQAGFELTMKVTQWVIGFTHWGVMAIIAVVVSKTVQEGSITDLFQRLGLYMITVIAALAIHAFITLPLLLKFIARVRPIRHFHAMSTPLLTAFSTASSSATLPLSMEAMEHNAGVSNKVTSFVLPMGSTINMDGTALYECVAAMFIAQAYGIELTIAQQVIVVFTSLLASIGAAGIPMAGLVMMSVVLTAVGLPLEGVGLILAVDRILDMFRTSVNVWSDCCGAVVIARSEKEKLPKLE